jgi:hypothetical protein
MGECGCGSPYFRSAHRIAGSKVTLGVQVYPGCRDCCYGPGVVVSVFDRPDVEWLEGVEVETVQPDDCGGSEGLGIPIPLFDMEDLVEAAKELCSEGEIGPDGWLSLAEWLEDGESGYKLIYKAIARRERHALAGKETK